MKHQWVDYEYSQMPGMKSVRTPTVPVKSIDGPVWKTSGGLLFPVADMTDRHILNCITMIEEGRLIGSKIGEYTIDQWLIIFDAELEERVPK